LFLYGGLICSELLQKSIGNAVVLSGNSIMIENYLSGICKRSGLYAIGESLFLRKLLWASLPNKRQKLRDR
jgi:hypothetical protein